MLTAAVQGLVRNGMAEVDYVTPRDGTDVTGALEDAAEGLPVTRRGLVPSVSLVASASSTGLCAVGTEISRVRRSFSVPMVNVKNEQQVVSRVVRSRSSAS
ncbi:hypothetical protein [Actinomadura sp. DC4]|uniref:hypothetical protein n=1 Tax=Actinomadura sp. DC4 TaxID=3055069 RepID=UPI0025B17109|nr:hypothetical protein [Actinomadura sp. DC4]MDN3353542.1 hypothetical protein [Actinomadura sp. DC4]